MRIADFGDRLLALLDVLDELDGALVALFDVVARVFVVGAVARDKFLVGRIETKLRQVFVVHDDQPLVSVLDEGDVGLDQASLDFVVLQAGARDRGCGCSRARSGRPRSGANGLGDLFVLLVLNAAAGAGRRRPSAS